MPVRIEIACDGGDWPPEDEMAVLLGRAVDETITVLDFAYIDTELSVLLTTDDQIRTINAQWRAMDKPTNVLSFPAIQCNPGEKPGPLLGDVIFAYETIGREAAIDGKAVDDHLTHLAIHGLLHLLGYDHETDEDAEVMEGLERRVLARLGIDDPYIEPDTGEE